MFETGDREVDVFGLVDYTLRRSVSKAIDAVQYLSYTLSLVEKDGESVLNYEVDDRRDEVERYKNEIETLLTKHAIELEQLKWLMDQYVEASVSDRTDDDALSYRLATMYAAGVAYNHLLYPTQG